MEGIAYTDATGLNFSLDTEEGKTIARRLEATSAFGFGPGVKDIVIDVMMVTMHPEVFIWCFCNPPFESAKEAMCVLAPAEYRYDACIAVADILRFTHHIGRYGTIDGRPIVEVLPRIELDVVRYQKKDTVVRNEDPAPQSAFVKPEKYAVQQEGRLVFWPTTELDQKVLDVRFPIVEGLLRQIL